MQLSPSLWEEILHRASLPGLADREQPGPVPKSLVESQPVGGWRLLHGSTVDAAQHALHAAPQPASAAAAFNQRELIPH